jgi:uncharacterized protein Yka (UPF0111/DUF47 family)
LLGTISVDISRAAYYYPNVISLQKFFGKDTRFFDLIEGCAFEATRCAQALQAVLSGVDVTAKISELRMARLKSKEMSEEISELVVTTFVTVLEREDLEALAGALYKIPKPLEKFAERYTLVSNKIDAHYFARQCALINDASTTVYTMCQQLRKGINIETIKRLNVKLQQAESEADTLEVELLRDLYNGSHDPLRVLIMKDLYDLLEKGIDRCRDAGNVITHTTLKNS